MAITLRQTSTDPTGKSSALTHQEMNDNLKSYYQSSSLSGSTLELHTVSDTHSVDLSSLGGGTVDTGSVYISSSVDQNRITFTQGDGSTQTLVIETGSADDSITYFTESISGDTATWTTSFEEMCITSANNRIRIGTNNVHVHTGDGTVIIGGSHGVGSDLSASTSLLSMNTNTCALGSNNIVLGNFSGTINSSQSVMIGTWYSQLNGDGSFMLGGRSNQTTGNACYGGIIGGTGNLNNGSQCSVVIGGSSNNLIIANSGGILGGYCNEVRNYYSTVLGGCCNKVSSRGSNITGGCSNNVIGDYSIVLSSKNTTVQGAGSLVFSPNTTTVTETRSNIARFDVTLLEVSGALSASGLVYPTTDGTAGQVIVTDGSGVLSFASVSGSGGTAIDTGSFYVSSSVDRNTITFTQGDGTVETVTIETGSADDSITYFTESVDGTTATWTTSYETADIKSDCNRVLIAAGSPATIDGNNSAIIGGTNNYIACANSVVLAANVGIVRSQNSAIIGGASGCVLGDCSVVIGGLGNCIMSTSGDYSAIVGGSDSKICDASTHSSILGGLSNCVTNSLYASVIGGSNNRVTNNGHYSAIFASFQGNIDNSEAATVVGGICGNVLNSHYSIVGGGCRNKVSAGSRSVILGGALNNTSNATQAAILAGTNNCIDTSNCSVVIGGTTNDICSTSSNNIILGGISTTIDTPAANSTLINSRNTTLTGACSLVFSPSTITVTEARDNIVRLDTSLLEVSGALSASGLVYPTSDGTAGQVITTDGSGVLSFATVSGGGPTVDTGSFYVSSSVDRNVITFTQGDGSVESITIETGSADDVITEWVESTSGGNSSWTSTTPIGILDSTSHTLSIGTTSTISLSGNRSSLLSGCKNLVTADDSAVIAGFCNRVYGNCSGILAGNRNTVDSPFSAIIAGYENRARCSYNSIVGAASSNVCANYSMIGASSGAVITDASNYSTMLGTLNSDIEGTSCHGTILGSANATINNSIYSTIIGGSSNGITDSDYSTTIGRNHCITSNGDYSGIFAGFSNRINGGQMSVVIGGSSNVVTGDGTLLFGATSITEARNCVTRFGSNLVEVDGHFSASGLLYPTSDGTAGQVITTDGSGVLSFASAGGASTLTGLTDTNISALPSTGSYLYWNGAEWLDDNTNHTLGIQDSNTLINVATPNSNDVILFEQGEGLAISYDTNTVTFDIDLDWSSSYVDATQASSVWDAQGTGTDINAVLQAKGTGATTAQTPDGATTGGASRGTYATDFQKQRNNPNQVASGANSVIVGGSCNRAYGSHSTVLGGQENTAGGTFSTVLGGYQSCVGSSGTYSTALGNRAQVNAVGSFLFRDGSGTTPYVLTDNNTAAFVASKFYVEGTHEVSGSSFSSVGSPATLATSPTTVAVTVDADDHNFFELTLAASTTHTIAISNGQPGQTIVIKITQPSSGTPGLVSWSGATNIKEAFDSDNNVTSLNSAEDIFTLVRFGTDWYLNAIKRFS